MTRDEWARLYDNPEVQVSLQYVDWLAATESIPLALALTKDLDAGKSRIEQLRRYNAKQKDPAATFRPYAPIKLSPKARADTKRAAAVEGIATTRDPFPWRCRATSVSGRCRMKVHDGDRHDFS